MEEINALSLIDLRFEIQKIPILKKVNKFKIRNISKSQQNSSSNKLFIGEQNQTKEIAIVKIVQKLKIQLKPQIQNGVKNKDSYQKLEFSLFLIRQQVQQMKKLKHRNILRFYDYFQEQTDIIFFSQYSEGLTLEKWIQINSNLTFIKKLQIFRQIVEGVIYLHSKQIFHLNICPTNIYCSRYEPTVFKLGQIHIKYVQFQQTDDLTYNAPEFISSQFNANKKSDIWSLGVLLYNLLYSSMPWKVVELKKIKMFDKGKIQQPPKFSSRLSIPPSVNYLIEDMLQLQLDKRISIKELSEQLKKILYNLPK